MLLPKSSRTLQFCFLAAQGKEKLRFSTISQTSKAWLKALREAKASKDSTESK